MNSKSIVLGKDILAQYPDISVGYILTSNLDKLVGNIEAKEYKNIAFAGINENHLTVQNLADFSRIRKWREIYSQCGVKPKTYKSSIESLLRRFIEGSYKSIIPIVDLYNHISAGKIISIGGYNWDQIEGSLTLRKANAKDKFIPLSGRLDLPINLNHIVYADNNKTNSVVCWMWNHKDSSRTMLTSNVSEGLFIFDCLEIDDLSDLTTAMSLLEKLLVGENVNIVNKGILNAQNPSGIL